MAASGGRGRRFIAVSFDADVWAQEVDRLRAGGPTRRAAEQAREQIGGRGVPREELLACRAAGEDGTRLARCLKVYVPLSKGAPSERPYGFVFEVAEAPDSTVTLRMLAFGERHPRPGTRSVYERAHKRLHGRYPDQ